MKKISTLTCATIIAAQLLSCSKKDSGIPSSTTTVVGNWQEVGFTADRPVPIGDTVGQNLWSEVLPCDHFYLSLKSGGSGGQLQVNDCGQAPDTSGVTSFSWAFSNNKLALTTNGQSGSVNVTKLTADTLQWTAPAYNIDPKTGDTVNYIGTETFTRL